MSLSNKGYDRLKFVALVFLPGAAAAYFSLAQIWHLPNAEEVVGTATILDTFLGLLLKASSITHDKIAAVEKAAANRIDGDLIVTVDPDDGAKYLTLHVSQETINTLEDRKMVKLMVGTPAKGAEGVK